MNHRLSLPGDHLAALCSQRPAEGTKRPKEVALLQALNGPDVCTPPTSRAERSRSASYTTPIVEVAALPREGTRRTCRERINSQRRTSSRDLGPKHQGKYLQQQTHLQAWKERYPHHQHLPFLSPAHLARDQGLSSYLLVFISPSTLTLA